MPIRFYCPYCDQLLGIASRKAGSAIECPRCQGRVGVPAPGAAVPVRGPAPNVEPVMLAADIRLGPNHVALLFLTLLVLLGMAFIAGLVIGWCPVRLAEGQRISTLFPATRQQFVVLRTRGKPDGRPENLLLPEP